MAYINVLQSELMAKDISLASLYFSHELLKKWHLPKINVEKLLPCNHMANLLYLRSFPRI